MRFNVMLGMLLTASAQMGSALPAAQQAQLNHLISKLPEHAGHRPRGKGKQAKPAKRLNRKTVSYRTKARHKRAA